MNTFNVVSAECAHYVCSASRWVDWIHRYRAATMHLIYWLRNAIGMRYYRSGLWK